MKYAISAATGNFGQIVIPELLKKINASDITAIVRNTDKAKKVLPAGINIEKADYTDKDALTKALKGIDKLLFISSVPGGAIPRETQHKNVVDAAKDAGVSYIAYTSFAKADDVLNNAARAIAEIITESGYINIDFADVNTIMRNGKVAIMNTGFASGEERITNAIKDALNSPLLNANDVNGAGKVLLSLYCSEEHSIKMEEITQIHEFMEDVGEDVDVIWGATFDETLGEEVKITLIATGFDVENIPGMPISILSNLNKEKTEQEEFGFDDDEEDISEEELRRIKEEKISIAKNELYGDSVKTSKKEPEPEEMPENVIVFDTDSDSSSDTAPIIDITDIASESELEKIERIPSWKRRFFGK